MTTAVKGRRATSSHRVALERLAQEMCVDFPSRGTYAERLGSLAWLAMRMRDPSIRDAVRFTGKPYARGLAGWKQTALEWLKEREEG